MEAKIESNSSDNSTPVRALVLPGGGGRGAYQVGVAKALIEQGYVFDYAFGTSIGGLNAALIAQGDIRRLEELWCSMRAKDIYHLPSPNTIGQMVLGHHLGILDTHPLEEVIRREVSLHKLKTKQH